MKILNTNQFISERMKIRPVTNAELDQIKQDMNADKYELTDETIKTPDGETLHRIKALRDIPFKGVKKDDLGGWIESYTNLDQEGDCWVEDDAKVYGNAKIYDNAWVHGNAKVFKDAKVYGNAKVYNSAMVHGNAEVYDNATISSNAQVRDNAKVYDDAWVYGDAKVYGDAHVYGTTEVHGNAKVNYDVKDTNIDK